MASYNIYGTVRSQNSNNPIANVTINVYRRNGSGLPMPAVTTGPGGNFQFVIDPEELVEAEFPTGSIEIAFGIIDASGAILLSKDDSFIWTPGYEGDIQLYIPDPIAEAAPTTLLADIAYGQGKPMADDVTFGPINFYLVGFRSETLLGTATPGPDGLPRLVCDQYLGELPPGKGVRAGVVMTSSGTSYSSPVVFDLRPNPLHISITISDDEGSTFAKPEHQQVSESIIAIAGNDLSTVDLEQEVEFLARETREPRHLIEMAVKSHRLSNELATGGPSNWEPVHFYALLRQQMPEDMSLLLQQPSGVLKGALSVAVSNNIIPSMTEAEIDDLVSDFRTVAISAVTAAGGSEIARSNVFNTFGHVVAESQDLAVLVQHYIEYTTQAAGNEVDFWSHIENELPEYATVMPELKAISMVSSLALNNPAIAKRAFDILKGNEQEGDPSIPTEVQGTEASGLVHLGVSDWQTVIANAKAEDDTLFTYPSGIIGATDEERNRNYARLVTRNIRITYPLQYTHSEILSDSETPFTELKNDLGAFRLNNPEFDLRTASIIDMGEAFDFTEVADKEAFIEEIASVQRLVTLTTDYEVISKFIGDGLQSSLQISRMPLQEYLDEYQGLFETQEEAEATYELANIRTMHNITKAFSMVPFDMFQYDNLNSDVQPEMQSMSSNTETLYAEWRNLFGTIDSCGCSQCQSVFSPAAYLIDLLQFLRNNSMMYDNFRSRRPDIQDIALTCRNANTAVPYIDIVNELLEDIIHSNGGFSMYARQTEADASYQRAIPEHLNTYTAKVKVPMSDTVTDEHELYSPYFWKLRDRVYPMELPYNYFKRQMQEYFKLAGINESQALQRFSGNDFLSAWNDLDFCSEYTGITKFDREIITGAAMSAYQLYEFYGFKLSSGNILSSIADPASRGKLYPSAPDTITTINWKTVLSGRVDVFLQQTGLEYTELLELLDCYTLNPVISNVRMMAVLPNAANVPDDTCRLDQLKIHGMEYVTPHNPLNILHRFVRLKKALGWSYYELDKALVGLQTIYLNDETFKKLVQVKYVSDTLGISVENATIFWSMIQTLPYRDYKGSEPKDIPTHYERLYRNPLLSDVREMNYPFKPTVGGVVNKAVFLQYLSAIYNFPALELDAILENIYAEIVPSPIAGGTDVSISIGVLTRITREIILAKALGTSSAAEWLFYKRWLTKANYFGTIPGGAVNPYDNPADPFQSPIETIRFISFVRLIKSSGIQPDIAEYLLHDSPQDAAWDNNNNESLSKIIRTLRGEIAKRTNIYNPAYDFDGGLLEKALQQVMTSANAAKLKTIVQKPSAGVTVSYTQEEKDLLADELGYLLPDGETLLTEIADITYIEDVILRRAYTYERLQSLLSSVTGLDKDRLGELLEQVMTAQNAEMLLEIVLRPSGGTPQYTDSDRIFIDEELRYFIPEDGKYKLADTTADSYISGLAARQVYVFGLLRAYLSGSVDVAMDELEYILLQIMATEDAAKLKGIIMKPSIVGTVVFTAEEQAFIDGAMRYLLPEGAMQVLTIPAEQSYLSEVRDRRLYILGLSIAYLEKNILKPYIASFFAKEFRMEYDLVRLLMEECIKADAIGDGASGFDAFTAPTFISSIHQIDRWAIGSLAQFTVALRLQKAAILVSAFGLDLNDVSSLWEKNILQDVFPIGALPVRPGAGSLPQPDPEMAVTFVQFARFLYWMQVRAFVGTEMPLVYETISLLGTLDKENVKENIADAFRMSIDDVSTLLGDEPSETGILNATYLPDDNYRAYRNPHLYIRLAECLETQHDAPATMAVLHEAISSLLIPEGQLFANRVIQIVKAQYSEEQWVEAIRPVNDRLRVERRDAMLTYLLHNPPSAYKTQWHTSMDIYETLMIDVEMMTCMTTTRILSAINTIQTWMDRVMLGIERDSSGNVLTLRPDKAREWVNWRKLYRVWEANRKVFIYPENWIEPELRDNRSPFFKELEKFLQQNEIDNDNVYEAYHTYLERLEEVAHLEVVGFETERKGVERKDDIIHVFGRTHTQPHMYYYRRRQAGEWTAWEKMDVEIDSNYVVPVFNKGKLRLYWLEMGKHQKGIGSTISSMSAEGQIRDKYPIPDPTCWKIHLAWTEYKNKVWTSKEVSKDVLYSHEVYEEEPISPWHAQWFAYMRDSRNWYMKGSLDKIKENMLFYYRRNGDGSISFDVHHPVVRYPSPQMKVHVEDWVYYSSLEPGNPNSHQNALLKVGAWLSKSQLEYNNATQNSFLKLLETLRNAPFGTKSPPFYKFGRFVVKSNHVIAQADGGNHGCYTDVLRPDNLGTSYKLDNSSSFAYKQSAANGYKHYFGYMGKDVSLFKKAPDGPVIANGGYTVGKRILMRQEEEWNPTPGYWIKDPYFFYKDHANCFLAVPSTYAPSVVVGPSSPMSMPAMFAGLAGAAPMVLQSINDIQGYRLYNFYHGKVQEILDRLYTSGNDFDGFFDINYQDVLASTDTIGFNQNYEPTAYIDPNHPGNQLKFSFDDPNSIYNWELYFHIPLLIANKLSQNQKFDEARKWYHYVFNPVNGNNASRADFWNFREFRSNANNTPTPLEIMSSRNLDSDVARWAANPFNPHLIARTRISAYMKNTVMKYLDNLISWGDMLFRRDTRESINEATILYVMAAQLLGRKPTRIPARATPKMQTPRLLIYNDTWNHSKLNAFSNALVKIESLLLPSGSKGIVQYLGGGVIQTSEIKPNPNANLSRMFFFCIPNNDKLHGYWDIVGDRLFKIRNCQSIDGVERELALFDPPIDPAVLIKAAASGVSISDALADMNAPLPIYRFRAISQKATELTQEVKALGSQLLSALEKKDAEYLAVLRSTQEIRVLEANTETREMQINQAVLEIRSLNEQKKIPTQRIAHYQGLIDTGLNTEERSQLQYMQNNIPLHKKQGRSQTLSSSLNMLPSASVGSPFAFTFSFGGSNLGAAASASAANYTTLSSVNADMGAMAGAKAGFARRAEEWKHQLKVAQLELEQIDRQMASAELRKAIAEVELRNHKVQVRNAQEMAEQMQRKYTNEELYNWMISQISYTYFQAYKLAYETAKKAEKCYRHELSVPTTDFIRFGYWDTLKKGLLAGEQLMYDLKRMEVAYMDNNHRQYELTKDVSLAALNPNALMELRLNKSCTVEIPEWLFDMDYPGQHMRRIKSVSISIPCVAGPYTTVACKLSLLGSRYRKDSTLGGAESYQEDMNNDSRFTYMYGAIKSIATSSAQNDSGMFELNFQDERYLPFEGAGAISRWKIDLPAAYAQFDYNSISDIIIQIKYTAVDNGALRNYARQYIGQLIKDTSEETVMHRLVSLRSEFANEWSQMIYGSGHILSLTDIKKRLPYLVQKASAFTVQKIEFFLPASGVSISLNGTDIGNGVQVGSSGFYKFAKNSGCPDLTAPWEITMSKDSAPVTASQIKDAWMIIHYKAEV